MSGTRMLTDSIAFQQALNQFDTARLAAVAARDVTVTKANQVTLDAASVAQALAAALAAQHAAEQAASAPGLTIQNGLGYSARPTVITNSPENRIYGMSSNEQSIPTAPMLQISQVGYQGTDNILELISFANDPKPLCIQIGKNRGDGLTGSATYGRNSQAGDRLVLIGFYSGQNSDGGSTTSGFSHAGYLSIVAEGGPIGGGTNTMIHLQPGVYENGLPGESNGIQVNSKSQVAIMGTNTPFLAPGTDYGAILRLGPGGANMPPMAFTAAPVSTALVQGALEFRDTDGRLLTHVGTTGSGGTLAREQVLTTKGFQLNPTLPTVGGTLTSSVRTGPDWIELTISVGASDLPSLSLTLNLQASLPAAPAITGSYYCIDPGAPPLDLQFSAKTNKISVVQPSNLNPLKANTNYIITMVLKQP